MAVVGVIISGSDKFQLLDDAGSEWKGVARVGDLVSLTEVGEELDLSDLADVRDVLYTEHYVLVADGVDEYYSAQFDHAWLIAGDGTDHTYIDQDLTSTGNPLFNSLRFTEGIRDATIVLDSDNVGVGVDMGIYFNRGTTDDDATLWWNETDDLFELYLDKVNSELSGLKIESLTIGALEGILKASSGIVSGGARIGDLVD